MNDLCKTDNGTELIAVSPKWRLQSANNRVPSLVRSPESLHGKSINVIFSPSFRHSVRQSSTATVHRRPASLPFSLPWSFFSPPPFMRSVARLHGTGFVPRGLARSFPLSLSPSLPKLHVQFHLQDGTLTKKVSASFVATCESEKSVNNPKEG